MEGSSKAGEAQTASTAAAPDRTAPDGRCRGSRKFSFLFVGGSARYACKPPRHHHPPRDQLSPDDRASCRRNATEGIVVPVDHGLNRGCSTRVQRDIELKPRVHRVRRPTKRRLVQRVEQTALLQRRQRPGPGCPRSDRKRLSSSSSSLASARPAQDRSALGPRHQHPAAHGRHQRLKRAKPAIARSRDLGLVRKPTTPKLTVRAQTARQSAPSASER